MSPNFQRLFQHHAANSLDKQLRLQEMVKGLPWSFAMDSGTLSFGTKHAFAVQILGSESEESGTWLWSWANEASGIPDALLKGARALKKFGEEKQIPEFANASFGLDECSGHEIALAASGLLKSGAYYRGPYAGGAVYLTIAEPLPEADPAQRLLRVPAVFTQLIASFELDHRPALAAYAKQLGLAVAEEGGALRIAGGPGQDLVARFDGSGRLASFEGTAAPARGSNAPAARPAQRRKRFRPR